MFISQKCYYALRAVYELSVRHGGDVTKVADIAREQNIPPRFLEVILSELRGAGLLTSKRGASGGYVLAKDPRMTSVDEVIRLIQGPVSAVACVAAEDHDHCGTNSGCAFWPLWREVQAALDSVLQSTNFADLVERQAERVYVPNYMI